MENLETMKRLSATAAGLGDSGLLLADVGEICGSVTVLGEEVGGGSINRSSFHSPACTKGHFIMSIKWPAQSILRECLCFNKLTLF